MKDRKLQSPHTQADIEKVASIQVLIVDNFFKKLLTFFNVQQIFGNF